MRTERTLVLLKPDAVQRGLVGRIVARLEDKGLKLVGLKLLRVSRQLAQRQYAAHQGKDFYEPLLEFITAGPVVAMVWEGIEAVRVTRSLMGPTFGPDAPPGTIRGDLGLSRRYNLIHGSDSADAAAAEIPLYFRPEELLQYDRPGDAWVCARQGDELL